MVRSIFLTLFLFSVEVLAWADAPLMLQIVELPPYMIVSSPSTISGLVIDPTIAALKKAGIPFVWEIIPAVRQLATIKNNQERICSVGWYKTAAREAFAKFSHPILFDSGFAGFANNNFNPPDGISIDELLADPNVTVLIKTGFIFGEYIDGKIANMKANREEAYAEMPFIFKMVQAGRAQITFAPLAEILYYESIGVISRDKFHIIKFKGMASGNNRYLMCSLKVDDELINKFNDALEKK